MLEPTMPSCCRRHREHSGHTVQPRHTQATMRTREWFRLQALVCGTHRGSLAAFVLLVLNEEQLGELAEPRGVVVQQRLGVAEALEDGVGL